VLGFTLSCIGLGLIIVYGGSLKHRVETYERIIAASDRIITTVHQPTNGESRRQLADQEHLDGLKETLEQLPAFRDSFLLFSLGFFFMVVATGLQSNFRR